MITKFKSMKVLTSVFNAAYIVSLTVLRAAGKLETGDLALLIAGMAAACGVAIGANLLRHGQRSD